MVKLPRATVCSKYLPTLLLLQREQNCKSIISRLFTVKQEIWDFLIMGSEANRHRKIWQSYGGHFATKAEHNFYEVFSDFFQQGENVYEIISQPKNFNNIYVNVRLSRDELKEIYVPDKPVTTHGIKPDALIRNTITGKEIYIELKRQDGWVEGKKRSAGRGNAHERLCKYFTPGLMKLLKKSSKITGRELPFWIVFQGDVTRDICRVKEIRLWFNGHEKNVFFWRNTTDVNPLVEHFLTNIAPLLD